LFQVQPVLPVKAQQQHNMNKPYTRILLGVIFLLSFGCGSKEIAGDDAPAASESGAVIGADSVTSSHKAREEQGDNPGIPAEIIPFVAPPFEVYEITPGDLNSDNLEDYIVVLYNPSVDGSENPDAMVPVLFLIRQPDKRLKLHLRHNDLMSSYQLGYSTNNMTIEADSTGGGFSLTYHTQGYSIYGSWSDVVAHFRYSRDKKDWFLETLSYYGGAISPGAQREREAEMSGDTALLEKIRSGEYEEEDDSADPDDAYTTPYAIKTVKDFGVIPLSNFSGEGVFDE